jgi:hypothetical protein
VGECSGGICGRNVRRITSFVRSTGAIGDFAKHTLPRLAGRISWAAYRLLWMGLGLDHPTRVR